MKYLFTACLLLVASCGRGPKPQGVEVGSAGEDCAAEVVALSYEILEIARARPGLQIDARSLETVVRAAKVSCIVNVTINGEPKDARNFRSDMRIEVDRDRWPRIESRPARRRLVAHEYFTLMGLSDSNYEFSRQFGPNNLCSRPAPIISAIETILKKTCVQVSDSELDSIERLSISGVDEILPGDLDRLTRLRTLSLEGSLTHLPPSIFVELGSLVSLNLAHNRIREIPKGVFSKVDRLETLDLSGNQITSLMAGAFDGLKSLRQLHLAGNPLRHLGFAFLLGLGNTQTIDELQLCPTQPIHQIDEGAFSSMPRVEKIELCFDSEGPTVTLFEPLGNVREVLLSGPVDRIPTRVWGLLRKTAMLTLVPVSGPSADWFDELNRSLHANVSVLRLRIDPSLDDSKLANLTKVLNAFSSFRMDRDHLFCRR